MFYQYRDSAPVRGDNLEYDPCARDLHNEVFTLRLHRDNRSADKHENIHFAKEFGYTEMLRIVTILSHREFHTPAERSFLRCIRMMFLKLSNIEDYCGLKKTFIPEIKTKKSKKEDEVAPSQEPNVPSLNVD